MTWARRFRIREELRGSLWLIPLVGAILGGLFGAGLFQHERVVDLPSAWEYSPATAGTLLSAIVGATAALTGFVITVTVLVVQIAIGSFSARYMRLWYRDRLLKLTLAVLVGTLTMSLGLMRRIEDEYVPNLGVTLAGALVVVGILLFLFFFHRFIQRVRPVAAAALVARAGKRAFDASQRAVAPREIRTEAPSGLGEPALVVRAVQAGSIQAVHLEGLVAFAREREAQVVLAHAVGDFVTQDAVLVRVYGAGSEDGAADAAHLRGLIALGDERTIQQDPAFALRVLVDIAIRALSPAVNDPTTAVQVLDYLGETLRHLASSPEPPQPDRDEPGPCVVLRRRRWEDVLALSVTEIRQYGAPSIQVVRRLRAMLEELAETVPPECRPAVQDELRRLDATVAERWSGSVDLDRASVAGRQGIGGASE